MQDVLAIDPVLGVCSHSLHRRAPDAESRGAPDREGVVAFRDTYFVARKVSMVSSIASHHGVWWMGASAPVTGEGCARSR